MNTTKIDIKKVLNDWNKEPSLKDIDVEKLSKEEREDLAQKLDGL